jgi:hypothetical protein
MQDHDETVSNTSTNPCFTQILVERLSRRRLLQGGLVAAGMAMLHGPMVSGRGQRAEAASTLFSFQGVPVSKADTVVVPPGYTAEVLFAWGDPVSTGPAFKADASNTAAEQTQQAGMHHDGMYFFPLPLARRTRPGDCSPSIMNTPMTGCCMLAAWSPGPRRKSPSRRQHTVCR